MTSGMMPKKFPYPDSSRKEKMAERSKRGSKSKQIVEAPLPAGLMNAAPVSYPVADTSITALQVYHNPERRPSGDGPWHLVFGQAFNRDRAKAHQALIEKVLTEVSGKKIVLSFEVDESAAPAKGAPSGRAGDADWSGDSEGDGPDGDSGVKKVLGVFGGRARPVKKKPGS